MPLYEYMCQACGKFEILQKFSDDALSKCPTCGRDVHRIISAPAIRFKGTGWYVTDYAKKPSNGASKEAGSSPEQSSSTPKNTTSKDSSASGSSPTK
ncbi:MAG: zinc ribbon domain-containing protein [Vicinamibacteria bacterium]|nr:zinc ribbon domain-containing protein [Vicinamibacteria bacterium]